MDPSTIPSCDDGFDCTVDVCDSETGCEHLVDDGLCNDEVDCTEDSCDAELGCLFVLDETLCDDGDPCNGVEVCVDGSCVPGEAPWPLVMFLLDTSGSMEGSMSLADDQGVVPICHDEKQEGFEYDRSRWIAVLEALTGTFTDYWCSYDMRDDDPQREDYLYSYNSDAGEVEVPHVVPHGEQAPDGLLDVYTEGVKFGMMALDVKLNPGTDASGGYSYGPDKEALGSLVNLGARNATAPWGALVPPPKEDTPADLSATKELLE